MSKGIFSIDPGPVESAFVYRNAQGEILAFGKEPNAQARARVESLDEGAILAIEQIASYGMAVGATVFATCLEAGRFIQAFGDDTRLMMIPRMEVKMFLCHNSRAKDPNIRQAILDLYGGRESAMGCKKSPGPLFGFHSDIWAAMGVNLTAEWKLRGLYDSVNIFARV